MPLLNYKINLILIWSANCVTPNAAANQTVTFAITDIKLSVVTLWTDDDAKHLQQLKSWFIRTINWNKYEPKLTTRNALNQYFDFLMEPMFQRISRFFVLPFNANDIRIGHSRYCF